MADLQLEDLIKKLKLNQQVLDLVQLMQPKDVVVVVAKSFDLVDKDAEAVTQNLIKHVHNVHYEGLSGNSIELGMQYPVPPVSKFHKDEEPLNSLLDDEENLEEDFINNLGSLSPTMSKDVFPQEPRGESGDWPYDGMTKAGMDPANKGRKKGFTK